jgi:hypothetical protein
MVDKKIGGLKSIDENEWRLNRKQAYHLGFDLIKHRLVGEVRCIMGVK